jgi:hypothetical protein
MRQTTSTSRRATSSLSIFRITPSTLLSPRLIRVCRPGGRVLATDFMWRRPSSEEARDAFLGQVCPGLRFDTAEDWVRIYTDAGLTNVEIDEGPFEMMSPKVLFRTKESAIPSLSWGE